MTHNLFLKNSWTQILSVRFSNSYFVIWIRIILFKISSKIKPITSTITVDTCSMLGLLFPLYKILFFMLINIRQLVITGSWCCHCYSNKSGKWTMTNWSIRQYVRVILHDIKGIRLVLVRQAVTGRGKEYRRSYRGSLYSLLIFSVDGIPSSVPSRAVNRFRICQQFQVPTN